MLLTTSFLLLVVHLTSQKSPNIAFDLSHLVDGEYPWDIDGNIVYFEYEYKNYIQVPVKYMLSV